MATRQARNTKATKPVIEVKDEELKRESAFSRWQQSTEELFGAYNVPSHRRAMAGMVAGCIVGAGLGYAGGQLLTMITVGAMALSGSAFLALLIYVIGIALICYATFTAGVKTMNYVVSSKLDEHVAKVRGVWDRVFSLKEIRHA